MNLPPLPRLSWLEIDVEALAHNLRVTRAAAGGVDVYAVVKADAYGHGIEAAAQAFVDGGAARLCVATFDEAVLLRDAGIEAPILVIFRSPANVFDEAADRGIELTVSDSSTVDELAARPANGSITVHVEVETGLGRAGLEPSIVPAEMARLARMPGVAVAGIWTHLATSEDAAETAAQVATFEQTTAAVASTGVPVPPRHVAASGATFARTAPSYEAVRPGLCLYGFIPEDLPVAPDLADKAASLRPALQLKARPLRVQSVPAGFGISYGSRWRAGRPSIIATLPVGYADAIPKYTYPGVHVLVKGRRAPVVGVVAMDAVMVDVTDIPGVDVTTEFTFIGRDGDDEISVFELARARNTISWEVIATLAQRIPRVYHAGPVLVGRRTLTSQSDGGEAR